MLDSFRKLKPEGTFTIRIGREVPEKDVNLAYVYVPPLKVEENVQIVDTSSHLIDNLVRLLRLESLVVPDWSGLLHYLDISPKGQFLYGATNMPSPYFALTHKFYDGVLDTQHALYFKYTFLHWDLPGLAGKYTGNSVAVLDETGEPLPPGEYYEVYFEETQNPNVYRVTLYAHFNTDRERTYRVRYNKVQGDLVIPGHEEILNAVPVYEQATMQEVLSAPQDRRIYAVHETVDDGYHIYVPQTAQADPRKWQVFKWKLSGRATNGKTYTFGWVSDRIIKYSHLLDFEKEDYDASDGTKKLTVEGLSAQDLLNKALPSNFLDQDHISEYFIEDNSGAVETFIQHETLPAKGRTDADSPAWEVPEGSVIIDRPIEFIYTVFPQQFIPTREWEWEAYGEGLLDRNVGWTEIEEEVPEIPIQWKLEVDVTYKYGDDKVFFGAELLDSKNWEPIEMGYGGAEWIPRGNDLVQDYNVLGFHGYYYKHAMDWENYEFSAKIYVPDRYITADGKQSTFMADDDCFGVLFKVRDKNNFCYFLWEREERTYWHHPIWLNAGYPPGPEPPREWPGADGQQGLYSLKGGDPKDWINPFNWDTWPESKRVDCKNKYGANATPAQQAKYFDDWYKTSSPADRFALGRYHKRVFACKSGELNKGFGNASDGVGYYASAAPEGWRKTREYDIKVRVFKKNFSIIIDGAEKIRGEFDSSFYRGSFGVFVWSQAVEFRGVKVIKYATNTVSGSKTYSDTLGSENDSPSSAKLLLFSLSSAVESLKNQIISQHGINSSDIIDVSYSVSSLTDGVRVFEEDGAVYGYIYDRSLLSQTLQIPVGNGLWQCRGVRYASKTNTADGDIYEYTVNDYKDRSQVSVPNVTAQQYASFQDALLLMSNYAGDDNVPEDFQDLYCAQHDTNEDLPFAKGMPYKSGTMTTWVWVKEPVSISPQVVHTDKLTVTVNGAQVYTRPSALSPASFTISLSEGWNEVKFSYEDTNPQDNTKLVHIGGDSERRNNSYVILITPLSTLLDQTGVYYAINSHLPGVYIWSTEENGANVKGTGVANFNEDAQQWQISLDPPSLPPVPPEAPGDIYNFRWIGVKTSDPFVSMWVSGTSLGAKVNVSPYKDIGRPATFKATIHKDEGLKYLVDIDAIKKECAIPSDIEPRYVRLRLALGDMNGRFKDERVNLRWYNAGRFVLDHRTGDNLAYLSELLPGGQVSAWTNFQDLMAIPVMAIKFDELRRIHVDLPTPVDVYLDNWYLRVRDGRFMRKMVLPQGVNYEACPELAAYAGQEVSLLYALPEYLRQDFDPAVPYMRQVAGTLERIDETTYKTAHAPLYEVLRVVSNPSTANEREIPVADVDKAKGLIYLREALHPEDRVVADYIYENIYYEYRGYSAFGIFFHLDLNPSPGHTFSALTDGASVVIPGDFPSLKLFPKAELPGEKLLDLCLYIYLRPIAVFIGDRLIEGSVRYDALFHTTEGGFFDPASPLYDPTAFLLARVYVRPNSSPEDVVVLDTRTRGGGLKEGYDDPNAWDIGYYDGAPYPSQGVILARFPKEILKEHGGRFTREEVEEAVKKYLAYGVLPIVEFF